MLVAQPRDGHIRGDAAILLQQLRVDDAADGPVDKVAGHALQERQGAGAGYVDLSKRRHVDDAGPFAEGSVLLGHHVEVRRARPAKTAPVGAPAPPPPAPPVVIDPPPARPCPQHPPPVPPAGVQPAGAGPAAPLPRPPWV